MRDLRPVCAVTTSSGAGIVGRTGCAPAAKMNSIRNRPRSHGVLFTRPRAGHETGDFYRNYVNVSLNFHRPSGHAEIKSDAKGKLKKIYKSYFTPFEAFTGHPTASKFLKNGRTLENSPKWPISRVIMNASLPRKKQRTTYSLHSHLSRNDGSEFQYRLLIGKYFHAAIY